jgi:tRNA 2-thiouridine synthesizing protein A
MTHPPAPERPRIWIDERGHRCPIPVVALARALNVHGPGALIAVQADDAAADADIPAWCRMKGAQFLGVLPPKDGGPGTAYVVRLPS